MKTIFFFIFFLNFNYLLSQQIINVAAKNPERKIISDSLELPATAYANEKVQNSF